MYASVTYRRPSTELADASSTVSNFFSGVSNLATSLAPAAASIVTALRRPTQYPGQYIAEPAPPPPILAPVPSFNWMPVLLLGGAGVVALVIFSQKRK